MEHEVMEIEKPRILVVDDLERNLDVMKKIFEEMELEIDTAISGNDALKMLLKEDYACLLLDVNMPQMDGYELAGIIRNTKTLENLPLIFVTAATRDEKDQLQAYSLGAVDFLYKPVVPEVVKAKVQIFIDLYRERKKLFTINSELESEIKEREKTQEILRKQRIEARLLFQVTDGATEIESFQGVLQQSIDVICRLTGWPVGHVYLPAEDGSQRLDSTKIWHIPKDQSFENFKEVTEKTNFEIGQGLPGRIFESGKPAWITNVVTDKNFPRNKLCSDMGVKGAFGFPIKVSGKIVAVLEFFCKDEAVADKMLLKTLEMIEFRLTRVLEKKQYDIELRNTKNQLANKANSLEVTKQDLEKSLVKVEHANKAKSQFLSSMSHELRTPLNAILGFSDLLAGKHYGPLNEKQTDYVSRIGASGKHLLELINDILDLSKIEADAIELNPESFSARELLDSVLSIMKVQFFNKDIKVSEEIKNSLCVINADRRRTKQIMFNLLSNALKYTPEKGEVKILVETIDDIFIKVSVTDNGVGIPENELVEIFSEFHQVESTRDEALGGTGVGLALTQKLTNLMGGEIGVISELEKGSTFWFTLPLGTIDQKDESDEERCTSENEKKTRKGHKILVAEDNENNLALILDMLSIQNHDVKVAKNGLEAVEFALSFKPNLILMDMKMPKMNGLEAVKQLRSNKEFQDTPIIALTASTGTDAEELQVKAGCNEHISKPIQIKKLFEVLGRYLK